MSWGISWPDLRRKRAQALVHMVMMALRESHIDTGMRDREISSSLYAVFYGQGVEILADEDRATMGLLPRGPSGWTETEIHALERQRLEALYAPMPPVVMTKPAKPLE